MKFAARMAPLPLISVNSVVLMAFGVDVCAYLLLRVVVVSSGITQPVS